MSKGLKRSLFSSLCASIIITAIISFYLIQQEKNIFIAQFNQNLSFVRQVLVNVQHDFVYVDYLVKTLQNIPSFKNKKLDIFNTNFDYFKILSIEDKSNINVVQPKTIDIKSYNNNTLLIGNNPYCVIDIAKLMIKLFYLFPKGVTF